MKVQELLQELDAEVIFQDEFFEYNDKLLKSFKEIIIRERNYKWKFEITLEKFFEDKVCPEYGDKYFDFFEFEGSRKTKKNKTHTDLGININTGDISQINPREVPVYNRLEFRGRFFNDYGIAQKERIFERIKYLLRLSFPNAIFSLKKSD